jgi:hypothetical protein
MYVLRGGAARNKAEYRGGDPETFHVPSVVAATLGSRAVEVVDP